MLLSRNYPQLTGMIMEGCESQKQKAFLGNSSLLLELSASDDLVAFKTLVEEEGHDLDESSDWYGRRIGSKEMSFEERTPLMIAAMFGSKQVLSYILGTGRVDVNRASGSDRSTALHCAVAGGSVHSPDVVKLLLDARANTESIDANGKKPGDLIAQALNSSFNSRRKILELMLNGSSDIGELCVLADQTHGEQILTPPVLKDGTEKKEYPVDLSLPDIKNGIYGTDEFRMFVFKVKPCSRAYSHDWTECPFVHPGENARRRDPRKYHYSCVPCPEFRKGSCRQGDLCEYAHGIFECWLHPAQYRTRLCKDETGCARRVCFFAHKLEELRPLYASTGSGMPSPRSFSNGTSSLDLSSINPLVLGSPSALVPPTSTPPMTPSGASSPMGGSLWQNQGNIMPPTLQLPGSRLKTSLHARNMDLEAELLGLEMSSLSSPSGWNNNLAAAAFGACLGDRSGEMNRLGSVNPTNLDDIFGSLDQAILTRQNMNQQLHSSYPTSLSSSPVRTSPSFGVDSSGSAVLNARAAAFAKRSQSFIDRSPVNRHSGLSSPASSATLVPSNLSDWGSPNGKLEWGIQKEELNKLRKSASFGYRSGGGNYGTPAVSVPATFDEPDVSWVQSLVKDSQPVKPGLFSQNEEQKQQCHLNTGGSEVLPQWVEQFYLEQEQMVA